MVHPHLNDEASAGITGGPDGTPPPPSLHPPILTGKHNYVLPGWYVLLGCAPLKTTTPKWVSQVRSEAP